MKILYTGSFRFPDKDAASQRVLGVAKALRDEGSEVTFLGWEREARQEDLINGDYIYQGFKYYSQSELDKTNKKILGKIFGYFKQGNKTLIWIRKYSLTNKISHIIVYNANSIFLLRLKNYCKKNNLKLICDCTEWYDGRHLPGGKFGIVNLDNNIRIRVVYPLIKNMIVISSFLKKYFEKKNCEALIIPPLVDFSERKWKSVTNANSIASLQKKVIYAGDPGKKDLLMPIIKALKHINDQSVKIEFFILGLSTDQFAENILEYGETIPFYIRCNGRAPLNDVPKYYQVADFSILLRENKRYANAGFPTKLVESLSAGIPVITNRTSDIPQYIIDGENGFLLNDISIESLIKKFQEMLSLSAEEIIRMKYNARNCATKYFDYRVYAEPIANYLRYIH